MEPAHGLHQDQSGVQALLRRADGPAPESHGPAELRERLRIGAPRERPGIAAEMEEAADHLREFHERPVPQRRARGLYPEDLRRHASRRLAYLSSSDQKVGSPPGT